MMPPSSERARNIHRNPPTRRASLLAAAGLLFGLFGASRLEAKEFEVGQGGLATIQQAVDAALADPAAKDTILIPPGVYDESVYVTLTGAVLQESLAVRRTGSGEVRVRGVGGTPAFTIEDAHDVSLKNLTLDSGNSADAVPALLVAGDSANIVLDTLLGVAGDDMGVMISGTSVLGAKIVDCDFSGMLGVGFWLDGRSHLVKDSVADLCGTNGFVLPASAANVRLESCRALAQGATNPSHPGVISVRGVGHRLRECEAGGGGENGFYVAGSAHRLEQCSSTGSGDSGFRLDGAEALLSECEARENLFGFHGGGQGCVVRGGDYVQNLSHGLLISQSGTSIESFAAAKNGGHGVYVAAGVVGAQVLDAKIKKNGFEAVRVEGDFNWIEGNQAKGGDGFVDAGTGNAGRENTVDGGQNAFP